MESEFGTYYTPIVPGRRKLPRPLEPGSVRLAANDDASSLLGLPPSTVISRDLLLLHLLPSPMDPSRLTPTAQAEAEAMCLGVKPLFLNKNSPDSKKETSNQNQSETPTESSTDCTDVLSDYRYRMKLLISEYKETIDMLLADSSTIDGCIESLRQVYESLSDTDLNSLPIRGELDRLFSALKASGETQVDAIGAIK